MQDAYFNPLYAGSRQHDYQLQGVLGGRGGEAQQVCQSALQQGESRQEEEREQQRQADIDDDRGSGNGDKRAEYGIAGDVAEIIAHQRYGSHLGSHRYRYHRPCPAQGLAAGDRGWQKAVDGLVEQQDGQHGGKGQLKADVEEVERLDDEHHDGSESQVAHSRRVASGEQGKAVDADHRGSPDGTGGQGDEEHVCPDGSHADGDGDEPPSFSASCQEDEELKDDADMQSADGQDMAGSRGLEGLSGVLAEAAFLAQCHGGDDGLLLRGKVLAANTFYEFVSQVDGFQTGAVERRQMAVGTGCRGSTALLFLQRGEHGASQQEGGEDGERLVLFLLHQDGKGTGREHEDKPVGGRKGDDPEVRNDYARHQHHA